MRRTCLSACRMNAQRKAPEVSPTAKHPRQSGMRLRYPTRRHDTALATANPGHPTQQLGSGRGRIVLRHCITPCDPENEILILPLFDQSMDAESVVAQNQHNVSRNNLVVRQALNREQIPRPYRRQHARPPRLQLNRAAKAKHLRRKTRLWIFASFQCRCYTWQRATRHSG